jgi:hypothetical protein
MGFRRSASDVCLYIKDSDDGSKVFILVYVDDLLVAANSQLKVDEVRCSLEKQFRVKHQPVFRQFLGMQISRDRDQRTVTVSQSTYARSVVEQYLADDQKISDIPGTPSVKLRLLAKGTEPALYDVCGKLRFLVDRTRPDMLVATNAVGSGAASPTPEHVRAARRILKYLKGTVESSLTLGGKDALIPLAFCDASYNVDGCSKSQFGYAIHLQRSRANIIRSKTSTTVPHSPCEAEIKAIDETVREIEWLRLLMEEVGHAQIGPTVVFTDSSSSIDQAIEYKNSSRARHYARDLNYLRDMVSKGVVRLLHVPGDENHADALTKDLNYEKFSKFARVLMHGHQ